MDENAREPLDEGMQTPECEPEAEQGAEQAEQTELAHQREREQIDRHYDSLIQQSEQLRRTVPDFDLQRKLQNERFFRLTAPYGGVSLEDAYYAVHREELSRRAARQSIEAVTRTMASGKGRPKELGGGCSEAAAVFDPRSMSRREREELKQRIYRARAQGRSLRYGE